MEDMTIMEEKLKINIKDKIFLYLAMFFASRLFKMVDTYTPDGESVTAVVFSNDELFLKYCTSYERRN